MLMLFLLLTLLSSFLPGVRPDATQNTGSAQKDTHGLFNVYFIPAYRVATNRTLKTPQANSGVVFGAGFPGSNRLRTTTTEKPRISGAASDVHSEQQPFPQATGSEQQPGLPLRAQPSAITQYLLGFRNRYQQYQQPNGYQQYQHLNGYQHSQQPNGYQQQQQYYPIPPGYYPFPTRSSQGQNSQGYFPFPSVYIPPSIIPKSATEPPLLPAINLNAGNYRASASLKDEAIIKSAQLSVTPNLVTSGPVYATAADEIQTTIEPAANSTVSDVAVTATEEDSINPNKKSTTLPPEILKTSAQITSTSAPSPSANSTVSDSKTSPASVQKTKTSQSRDIIPQTPESSSTEKAQAEEHRSISRHFEFSEDKEHSQVNATGDIRLTASRKSSMEGEASQKSTPAPATAAQGLSSAFPTFPSLPLNTPHPHSHPHPAIFQGPNGFFVGSYNPANAVGVIPPPANNDPYNTYIPFGHSAALNQGGFPVHPTLPTRYDDLYYGFAPGYPFGVAPRNNATSQGNNIVPPRPAPQHAQQQALQPIQPIPLYHSAHPRQFFNVAGPPQVPYSLPPQVTNAGYNDQPFQSPGQYSRFSNQVPQPPVERPFYAGDPAFPNGIYEGDTGNAGHPNRLYSEDPSRPSTPSRLYSADSAAINPDPLLNRGFGPPTFLNPGYARSDNAESNSGVTNYVSPVRGIGTAYEVKPGPGTIPDNYDRRASRRNSIEVDGDREQVAY